MEQLEALSQEQHQRYLELFGSAPADGGGFSALSGVAHQVGQRIQDTRAGVIGLQFSTAVSASYASATAADHTPLVGAAGALNVWASTAEESRRVNLEGANAITANARREAAVVGAVPDPESPAGQMQVLSRINEHQTRAAMVVEQAAAAEQAAGARAAAAGGDGQTPRVQAVDNRSVKEAPPPPPPPKPPVEGLPPEGQRPPVEGPLTEGPASRPSARDRGGRSLYDDKGGEWRYYPGDQWRHSPHWDFKPQPGSGSKWENIPIDGQPPVNNPDPIVTGLPPWLLSPGQVPPPLAVGPPQNPLLAPFPGASVPAPAPEYHAPPGPGLMPHLSAPHISAPPIAAGEGTAVAGEGAVAAGGGLLLLLLAMLEPG